jgi:hypothetical protein
MRPEVLLLFVFVLWGIAGKLDEPLEGFDPEPTPVDPAEIEDDLSARPLHLLCFLDQTGEGRKRQSPMAVLTAFPAVRNGPAGRIPAASHRLNCVVTDEQETP